MEFVADRGIIYRGEKVLLHRQGADGEECLVQWRTQEDKTIGSKDAKASAKEICTWMKRQEIQVCCPHVTDLSEGGAASGDVMKEKPDTSMVEMAEDVATLVKRARRILINPAGSEMLLISTMKVLAEYAKIPQLSEYFHRSDAVELLLDLLINQNDQVRLNATLMLKELASRDPATRMQVLLQLTEVKHQKPSSSSYFRQLFLDLVETGENQWVRSSCESTLPMVSPP